MSQFIHSPINHPYKTGFLLRLTFIGMLFAALVRTTYYALSEGFSLRRIESHVACQIDLSVPLPSKTALEMMSAISHQRFRYLKKGSQAYAFMSDDGYYILKLFKFHHLQHADWIESLPCPKFLNNYRNSLIQRRHHRVSLTLNSYKLATTNLVQECGLIYAQILPCNSFSLPITINDALGRRYVLDVAKYGFVMQKRAELVLSSFDRWIRKGDLDQAKQAIDSLVGLISLRSSKGIQDSDPDLHKNAGLVGTSAIFIDIGSFFANPAITSISEMKQDLKKIFSRFSEWLSAQSPELHDYLQYRIEHPEGLTWSPPKDMELPL